MTASKKLIQASAGNVAGGDFYPYTVDNSARFNSADSAKLTKTFSTPTNDKKYVFSTWFKMSKISNHNQIFTAGTSTTNYAFIAISDASYFWYYENVSGTKISLRTYGKKLFRDHSAWYHIVVAVDTTQATSTDRVKVYFNGELYTDWETAQSNHGTQNYTPLLCAANPHSIGVGTGDYTSSYVDGYLSQTSFIDGTAYNATDFGEDKNGVWVPKDVSGLTFGTNGFYLDFADSSALGNDVSGNNNDFTASGLTASDQMIDTPTNNFATLNPLDNSGIGSPSNGNLFLASATYDTRIGTTFAPQSGQWYWEIYLVNDGNRNILYLTDGNEQTWNTFASNHNAIALRFDNGGLTAYGAVSAGTSPGWTTSNTDIITVAFDADNGQGWFGRNSAPNISASPHFTGMTVGVPTNIFQAEASGNDRWQNHWNYGQDSTFGGRTTAGNNADSNAVGNFKYSPPTGYLALCTANLPEPTIGPNIDSADTAALPEDQFSILLYEGNSTNNRDITGVGFDPDLGIFKNRDEGYGWIIVDRNRGDGWSLGFDSGGQESGTSKFDSFITDGYRIDSHPGLNRSSIVNYSWKANGSGVSNTDGTITSTVSANTDAGISVVTYTNNNTASQSIGHGLGVTPKVIITKRLSGSSWGFFGPILGVDKYMYLDTSDAVTTASGYMPAPSSTVVNTGTNIWSALNYETSDSLLYCFAEVEGFSSFGSYTGNGDTSGDGPFIYTGFRPAFIMTKRTNTAGYSWVLMDDARGNTYNPADEWLYGNSSSAGVSNSSTRVDFLSNGFKCIGESSTQNASGATYIYMAFAENPFKYSNAR